MELLDVYDSQGNKTGRVVERGNKNEIFNNDEHIAVAIIYIENDKGEFLIQKTSKEKYMSVDKIRDILDKGLMNKGHYKVLEKILEYKKGVDPNE